MKQLLLIFFSVLLFFGNVGISIFTHSCREEGLSKSIFLASNDCNSNLSSDACCEEEEEDACCEEDKNTCCSDETQIVKLDEKYIQNHGITKILISEFDIPTIFYHSTPPFILGEIYLCINNWKEPPPKSRKIILIQNQVFRI